MLRWWRRWGVPNPRLSEAKARLETRESRLLGRLISVWFSQIILHFSVAEEKAERIWNLGVDACWLGVTSKWFKVCCCRWLGIAHSNWFVLPPQPTSALASWLVFRWLGPGWWFSPKLVVTLVGLGIGLMFVVIAEYAVWAPCFLSMCSDREACGQEGPRDWWVAHKAVNRGEGREGPKKEACGQRSILEGLG